MKTKAVLTKPFPFFGGKRLVANHIWRRLGNVANFIEPFAGGADVLLARPHPPQIETVNDSSGDFENNWRAIDPKHGDPATVVDSICEILNDLDPYISNVWRSLKECPEETAEWADHPVNENHLHAIHKYLVLGEEAEIFRKRMGNDPDYYDPKRAGRWLFGICCWIGGGWCAEGVEWKQRCGSDGLGVHKRKIHLNVGTAEHAQRPIVRERPHLSSGGMCDHKNDRAETCQDRRGWLLNWFFQTGIDFALFVSAVVILCV